MEVFLGILLSNSLLQKVIIAVDNKLKIIFFSLNINNTNSIYDFFEPFEQVELLYKTLRSGINQKGRASYIDITIQGEQEKLVDSPTVLYMKSLLFLYLYKENIQWGKKTIKENRKSKTNKIIPKYQINNNYR